MAAFRLRKNKTDKPRKRLVMGVHPLPTMVTLGNLLCGFASIILSMRVGNPPEGYKSIEMLYYAGLLIFIAMIFDVMDGRVARWTKTTSKFGMEMDSLCDVVSFGVAPAVLVKAAIDLSIPLKYFEAFPILDRYIWLMMAVYVCCAALRLARYNVEAESGHKDFFFGIPSPAAAGCVASLVVMLCPILNEQKMAMTWMELLRSKEVVRVVLQGLPFTMLCLGILMVSRVHYIHLGDKLLRGKKPLMHLMLVGMSLVLIIMQHEVMLALAFNGYLVFGLLNEVRMQLFPSTRPPGWDAPLAELAGNRPASSTSLPQISSTPTGTPAVQTAPALPGAEPPKDLPKA
jgi:CDP-diacylglycerol--serine O-phosphatidyltransferase